MKKIYCLFALVVIATVGCKKSFLDVPNNNQPDFKKVYSSGQDLENLVSSLFNTYYTGTHYASGVEPMLATAADNVSCSWGNFGMRDMSWEPRDHAWNNSPSYSYNRQTKYFFDKMYGVINTASNIMKAIDGGVNIGTNGEDNDRAKAVCKFAQGIAYGALALVFDKAFIVDENTSIDEAAVSSASPYDEVAQQAIGYLDKAIELSSGSFVVPGEWLGTDEDFSSSQFKQLCNTYAARILSYTPRNNDQLMAVDWSKVKAYADAGITSDFTVIMDNYVNWYDEAGDYLTYQGWGVTDMYVVHMMDPATQPQHWDDDPNFPYPPKSTNPLDQRLLTDFEYVGSNWFQPARGYYHYSSYRSKRYDDVYVNAVGPKPEVMNAENDMLKAEARVYTNDYAGAASIINTSTYKTRGQMPDVAENKDDLIEAIHHERHVEMYVTNMGLQFFEMRKLDRLQKGTPLHLPLPAKTLETFGESLPFYTFGGVANADGVNVSNKGWR